MKTLSIMTLGEMTLSITTLGEMTLRIEAWKSDTRHNTHTQNILNAECRYSEHSLFWVSFSQYHVQFVNAMRHSAECRGACSRGASRHYHQNCGLHYVYHTVIQSRIVTDDSRTMLFIVTSLTDESRAIIYVYSTDITYDDFQMMVILCLLFTLRQP